MNKTLAKWLFVGNVLVMVLHLVNSVFQYVEFLNKGFSEGVFNLVCSIGSFVAFFVFYVMFKDLVKRYFE